MQTKENEGYKYHKPYAEEDSIPNTETKKVVEWIGHDKTVLEFACFTGHLSSWLKKYGCKVTGVELNEDALEKAKPYLVQSIAGDIERPETWAAIKENSFDVVAFMHILEHLRDAETALKRGTEKLNDHGTIIIALPNVSNAWDRFEMLNGRFEYTDMGVMDRTHLRFFNQKTARELIEGAGLEIVDYFTPWQVNPLKIFFYQIPLFWKRPRVCKHRKPPRFPRFSRNMTDVVMLFKCRKKRIFESGLRSE